jgi:isopenicillin-N epimerase
VTSPTALVMPVAALVRELDRRGVDTIVDGAHAPGMIPLDVAALGAAYWTGNGHKWMCAPKGAAVLHVRSDLREGIHPLVVSHGANSQRTDRSRFRLEFDWTGTPDPTPILALPAAIRYVGGLHDEGWSGLMAANATMARRGRDIVCAALGVPAPAPDGMLGAMASIPMPGLSPTRAAADRLQADLFGEDGIEVPVFTFPVPAAVAPDAAPSSVVLRISAQRYNQPDEYVALADALVRRLKGPSSPRSLLGRLRRG